MVGGEEVVIGKTVHYVTPTGKIRPAIIIRLLNRDGLVSLVVFTDEDLSGVRKEASVKYSSVEARDTWHWPAESKEQKLEPLPMSMEERARLGYGH